MSEEENRFLTTGEDIRRLLSRCKTCFSITNNGNYVIFHTKLSELIIPKRNKISLIINSEENENIVGHWFSLIIYNNKRIFLCDGLDQVRKEPHVLKNIKLFCTNNNLILSSFSVRLQLKSSKKCGFLSLFWTYKLSILSLKAFINLRTVMVQQSIYSNETRAIKLVKKHFGISL